MDNENKWGSVASIVDDAYFVVIEPLPTGSWISKDGKVLALPFSTPRLGSFFVVPTCGSTVLPRWCRTYRMPSIGGV